MTRCPRIEKLRACLVQIETALYLMMRGWSAESVHTLLAASKGILRGLHNSVPNKVLGDLDKAVGRRVRPGYEKEWHKYEHKVANFFKHADRDAFEVLEGIDLQGLNRVEAVTCTLAVWEYVQVLPKTILTGFISVTVDTGSFFDFHTYLSERVEGRRLLAEIEFKPLGKRDKFLEDCFEFAMTNGENAATLSIPSLN